MLRPKALPWRSQQLCCAHQMYVDRSEKFFALMQIFVKEGLVHPTCPLNGCTALGQILRVPRTSSDSYSGCLAYISKHTRVYILGEPSILGSTLLAEMPVGGYSLYCHHWTTPHGLRVVRHSPKNGSFVGSLTDSDTQLRALTTHFQILIDINASHPLPWHQRHRKTLPI
jgi:hypothetical protein